jgi:hypothetical protein
MSKIRPPSMGYIGKALKIARYYVDEPQPENMFAKYVPLASRAERIVRYQRIRERD